MRGLAWGVLPLLLAGCSAGYARAPEALPAPATAVAPKGPTIAATFEVSKAVPASRDVEVAFDLAECTAVQDVLLAERTDRVLITLDIGGREGKDCTAPLRRHRTVRLAEPLGDRAVYDGSVSPPQRVFS